MFWFWPVSHLSSISRWRGEDYVDNDKDDDDDDDNDGDGDDDGGDSEEKATQSSNRAHAERSAVLNCAG